jgi:hypothetical protein
MFADAKMSNCQLPALIEKKGQAEKEKLGEEVPDWLSQPGYP